MPNSICSEGQTVHWQLHILGLKSESQGRLTGSWASLKDDVVRILTPFPLIGNREKRTLSNMDRWINKECKLGV